MIGVTILEIGFICMVIAAFIIAILHDTRRRK